MCYIIIRVHRATEICVEKEIGSGNPFQLGTFSIVLSESFRTRGVRPSLRGIFYPSLSYVPSKRRFSFLRPLIDLRIARSLSRNRSDLSSLAFVISVVEKFPRTHIFFPWKIVLVSKWPTEVPTRKVIDTVTYFSAGGELNDKAYL